MRTTLKQNTQSPDESLYIIELTHKEVGDIVAALTSTIIGDTSRMMVFASLVTRMKPESLTSVFAQLDAKLHPDIRQSSAYNLMKSLYMHRAELCTNLPDDFESK